MHPTCALLVATSLTALAPLGAGCDDQIAPSAPGADDLAEAAGALTQIQAVGTLDFLNGASATYALLDATVGLDKRAAKNIVAHVRGADGVLGTKDDDHLDTLAELDAIAYVGDAAMNKLAAYLGAHALLPDLVIEGIGLTNAQAKAVLDVANGATQAELNDKAGLDSRAAKNIVQARPLASLDALAKVAYVARVALEKLRAYASIWVKPVVATPVPTSESSHPNPPTGTMAPACTPTIVERTGPDTQNAADANALLAAAATGDWPALTVTTFALADCHSPAELAGSEKNVAAALIARVFADWEFPANEPSPIHAGPMFPGGGAFASMADTCPELIAERIADGFWDPSASSSEDQALYVRMGAIFEALKAPALADPSGYVELQLDFEADECSQRAVALVHPADGAVTVIRRWPRC